MALDIDLDNVNGIPDQPDGSPNWLESTEKKGFGPLSDVQKARLRERARAKNEQKSRERKRARVAEFNPDQPRDEQGQWTDSGGGNDAAVRGFAELVEQISKPDGGFTYQPVSGAQPKTGFALSIHKGREQVIESKDLSLMSLWKYSQANRDLLAESSNYMGAWHNPDDGKIYLDVSTVVNSHEEALSLGRQHSQLAYFDLQAGKSVAVK